MDHGGPATHPNLRKEPSDISNFSAESTPTLISSPQSPVYSRPTYRPIAPLPEEEDISYKGAYQSPQNEDIGEALAEKSQAFGLGISVDKSRRTSVTRVAVGSKASPGPPRAYDPLSSPPIDGGYQPDGGGMGYSYHDEQHLLRGNNACSPATHQNFTPSSEHEQLHRKPLSSTGKQTDPSGREFECRSKRKIYHPRGSWLSIIILVLAVYSTVFSGIWLALAIIRPRYRKISNGSSLPPSTASLLCAAIAKSIELSFATVFVAFLGQVLSRRAFSKRSKGITIADMAMRSWILQPGTLLTHWESVSKAVFTILGLIALIAAVVAMFYTTASDALVAPKLKYGKLESRILYGKVATQFANPSYVNEQCPTPISKSEDDQSLSTCSNMEHAGQALHNFQQYRSDWAKFRAVGNITARPNPVGLFSDNTTVTGSWLKNEDMTTVYNKFGRIVNNITMAMPHSGIVSAARDPINGIRQPNIRQPNIDVRPDVDALGEYHVQASVPSPAINILCAAMTEDELAPMIYAKWPGAHGQVIDPKTKPNDYHVPTRPNWLNHTAVDDVFGFGEKYDRRHPVFPKLPQPYNTILNRTDSWIDSFYMLATSPTSSYMLCSFRQSLTPDCSTIYRASLSGGSLESRCGDDRDALAYSKSDPKATNGVLNKDWINIGWDWALALALDAGSNDANASLPRLLSQLIPTAPSLNPSLPSIAEALAVLAGSTLLSSSRDSPFIHFWNYSETVPVLKEAQYQGCNASVRTQDYASGGTQRWQRLFYTVLATVFFINVLCLGYFLVQGGFVTDFIEPSNMFCLSVNSPPSRRLEGSCGGGPEKEQFRTKWFIGCDKEREHFFVHEGKVQPHPRRSPRRPWRHHAGLEDDDEMLGSPLVNMYTKLSKESSLL